MASLNPIVYIPPTFFLVAIVGILIYTYQDTLQDRYLEVIYRLQNYRRQGNVNDDDTELTEEQLRELYGSADAGDIPEELLRQFAEEDNNDDEDEEDDDEDDDEDEEVGGEGEQEEVQPQGSTTSARLRMHHEMVQQMRARAGFAPEPFPGDVVPGEEDGAVGAGEDGEDGEDDGGVGSSQGATAHRIKRVGKKKAEKLQRKEQMRAYHEFMEMQRTERRQQEEMFRIHEAAQQEERQRKRTAQIEKDRKRKEQLKEKEAKENDSREKRIQADKVKEETARRELRAYIQRVKSFKLGALAKRLDRSESQLLKDLAAIAQDSNSNNDSDVLITFANSPSATPSYPSVSTATASSSASTARQHFLILFDSASDQYVILDKAKLEAFAAVVQSKGRVDKKELSAASEPILHSSSIN
ncbi:hypothetical protein BGZ96_010820 [Linnemannia gamsii]|uniref:DDRGK domain-containing protein 1 n=1 Tax=Linnemannia gamsii TaxID=64522 RepID=A0ABQ7JTX7_9FUNG|nr:hypothetical protein BGZ96_010820 [Linnemannia gamsii]